MNSLFLILLLVSLVGLVVLIPMVIIDMIKKKKSNKIYKNTGIFVVAAFVTLIGFIFTIEETEVVEQPAEVKNTETEGPKVETSAIDMTYANDSSVPFGERLEKISTDLFGDTTVQKTDRNITVENMGEMYYLKMMFDDAVTKKGTVNLLNRQTAELFKVLQQVDGFETIQLTWQGNTSGGELTRVLTVTAKKSEIDAIDFENLDVSKLKDHVTNYGLHKDLK